jgi:hypothetical protein
MRDTWTRILRAACWWTCANCGHVNHEIGDCERCGR